MIVSERQHPQLILRAISTSQRTDFSSMLCSHRTLLKTSTTTLGPPTTAMDLRTPSS